MEPIDPQAVRRALADLVGQTLHLHLETTHGAYTEGAFGAFARNVRVRFHRAGVGGSGPFRVGLKTDDGWVYAEGLTHWQIVDAGRLLLAGRDDQGRLTVALELSREPFPVEPRGTAGTADRAAAVPAAAPRPGGGLLVVLAHPDDESFACAGLMALRRREGVPVTCVCVTGGQMGRNMGRPPLATRETLAAVRERELREAMAVLGVEDVRVLGFWDKTVEFEDSEELAGRIGAIVAELRPATVVTFHPERSGHPDHNAVGAATLRAIRRLDPARRPRVLCPAFEREGEPPPDLPVEVVDIAEVGELKLAALRAHRSQTQGWEQRAESDERLRRRRERLLREERFWVLEP